MELPLWPWPRPILRTTLTVVNWAETMSGPEGGSQCGPWRGFRSLPFAVMYMRSLLCCFFPILQQLATQAGTEES